MKRLLPLFACLPLLAACAAVEPGATSFIDSFRPAPSAPVAPVLPAAVVAAMPTGTNPNIVMKDGNGCYIYSIEKLNPQTGFLIRDSKGNPICEGTTVTQVAVVTNTVAQ